VKFKKISDFSNFFTGFVDRCPFAIDEDGKMGYDKQWRDAPWSLSAPSVEKFCSGMKENILAKIGTVLISLGKVM
jgi:hypothetical protein